MARRARVFVDSGVYHTVLKGIGGQILFEDEDDKKKMEEIIERYKKEIDFEIYVYVFMDNHIHFCIRDWDNKLSKIMQKIEVSYVSYFNKKYKRTGALFHGRFWSRPIKNERELFQLIKYILGNPEKAGISKLEEYNWSSYREYCDYTENKITDTNYVRNLIYGLYGEIDIIKFIDSLVVEEFYDIKETHQMVDSRVIKKVMEILEIDSPLEIMNYDKRLRDYKLRTLKKKGFSVWQLSRITGISQGIIEAA